MRKIKRPNLSVKTREVFYRLKRSKQLGEITEETIDEVLERLQPLKYTDMGCLYESFSRSELESALARLAVPACTSAGLAVATLGNNGLEKLMERASDETGRQEQKILVTWAQALLDKISEFTNALIREEAAQENLEAGPTIVIAPEKESALVELTWQRLAPPDKIGVRLERDAATGSAKIWPLWSRVWLVPWLSKKEKKQLAALSN